MAYETPITIKKAIDNISKRHYVLPSIQREFVWDTEQIETLFDSLMRDYPIGTFLFWKVDKSKIKEFQFYEFLKKYHEKDSFHNRKAELIDNEDIIALLDGQQRMTSMYVALTGSYAKKMPRLHKNSAHAYPEKKLYLNLLQPSDDFEVEYDFKFLTEKEAEPTEGNFWFECGKILEFQDVSMTTMFLMDNGLIDSSAYSKQQTKYALNTLNKFFNVVHEIGTISYYLEEGEDLDKVLQIFIRINSGGTQLSYSDLLLSIATAEWKEKYAREVIHDFVDDINKIGDGFSFNKDIVLKSCLVLADLDVKFKVVNFTKKNMATIEKNWEKSSVAVQAAVELVAKLGYNRNSLVATNTIIPIAYFIYKNDFETKILHSAQREDDRKSIKEWLARVLLKGIFGGNPDSIYPKMRDLINRNQGKFPLKETISEYKGSPKSISFTEDDIESLLDQQYGQAKTFCALTLLYPGLNNNFKYHQDHIHPKSFFTKKNLKTLGMARDKIEIFTEGFNKLSNLQLLQATQNIEKTDTPFSDWLEKIYGSQTERESFLRDNHIKPDESLAFEDFPSFISNRRKILKEKLIKILNVSISE
jgi:uncharacterized protein with ParB-like and HNH nuclease domain